MKSIVFILLCTTLSMLNPAYSQAPQGFNYQATVRDNNGNLIVTQNVYFKFNIMQGSQTSLPIFSETHYVPTDDIGQVSLVIGQGTATVGTFSQIDWSLGSYYLGIELNTGNGYVAMGTTQLLSVPYALYAANSGNTYVTPNLADVLAVGSSANGKISNVSNPIDAQDVSTKFYVDSVAGVLSNQYQILSKSNDTLYLTNGGFVVLDSGFSGDYNELTNAPTIPTNLSGLTNDVGYLTSEQDSSITNELQALSISGDTIFLSNGGFVKLPDSFSGDYNDLTNAPTNLSSFTNDTGFITSENQQLSVSTTGDTLYLSNGNWVLIPGISAANSNSNSSNNVSVTVGDQFQGGIVAYILQPGDNGYDPNLVHGLIATPYNFGPFAWGCYGTLIGTSDSIGKGMQNTIAIVNNCNEANTAARVCYDLVYNGYSDWYLPSHQELRKLFFNRNIIGGFITGVYQGSTEFNEGATPQYSQWKYGNDGSLSYGYKYEQFLIRPIRSF